jgi:DeoR/GlpR family transcriptional regulator of sugar metabolism
MRGAPRFANGRLWEADANAHEHAVSCETMRERASLLSAERRRVILETLDSEGKVVAARLVEELGVSEDTIRRDLRELADAGLVQRVHGGALPPAPQPGSFAHRREAHTAEKAALASAGAALLGRARVVVLDGSTTNLELAGRLPSDGARTVLTNSPPIAAALAEHPTAEVVMIGGRLDKRAQVTVGPPAIEFLRSVRADACVLGVCALHPETGLSTDDLEEAHVKRAMVEASADVIALATADKLAAAGPYLVAPVSELTHVVAEAAAPDALLDAYRAIGVTVTRA